MIKLILSSKCTIIWWYCVIHEQNHSDWYIISFMFSALSFDIDWTLNIKTAVFVHLLLNHTTKHMNKIYELQIYWQRVGLVTILTGVYAVWFTWCGLMEVDWCHIVPGGGLAEGQGGRSQKCPPCYTGAQCCCQPAPLPPSPRATRG